MCPAAERTASPVPLGSSCTASSTPSGNSPSSRRCGPSTTTIRPAPASCAARIGQPIIGRPQIGCSTFGVSDFMRVPSPAARISTVGAGTRSIVVSGRRSTALGGGLMARHRFLVPADGGSIPPPPASVSGRRLLQVPLDEAGAAAVVVELELEEVGEDAGRRCSGSRPWRSRRCRRSARGRRRPPMSRARRGPRARRRRRRRRPGGARPTGGRRSSRPAAKSARIASAS